MFKKLINSYLLTSTLTMIALSGAAYATDQESKIMQSLPPEEAPAQTSEPVEEAKDAPAPIKAGPKLRELQQYTLSLLKGLDEHQAEYIYKIRQEFGVIRSVQVIRSDIEKAVESCAVENPTIKEQITTRYQTWNEQIVPKLGEADVALKDAIQRQSFRPTVRVTILLDHVQAAFEERDAKLKKVPITNMKACEALMGSLDDTEENLKSLMDQTISELESMSPDPEKTAAMNVETKEPAATE